MPNRCRDTVMRTAVGLECATTNCKFAQAPPITIVSHVTEIDNRRTGSLHQIELCVVAISKLLGFNGQVAVNKKIINVRGLISSGQAKTHQEQLTHGGIIGTDEVRTTIEFFDATQRIGPSSIAGSKETYDLAYEMDVI